MRPLVPADMPAVQRLLAQSINAAALGGGSMDNSVERVLLKTTAGTYALAFGLEFKGSGMNQSKNTLVAVGSLNSIDHINRAAEIGAMVLDEDMPPRKRLMVARTLGADLVRHAFNDLNLRRVAARALVDFPLLSHMHSIFSGMVKEGMLREAVYQDGRYHDVEVWGLLRKDQQQEGEHHGAC